MILLMLQIMHDCRIYLDAEVPAIILKVKGSKGHSGFLASTVKIK